MSSKLIFDSTLPYNKNIKLVRAFIALETSITFALF